MKDYTLCKFDTVVDCFNFIANDYQNLNDYNYLILTDKEELKNKINEINVNHRQYLTFVDLTKFDFYYKINNMTDLEKEFETIIDNAINDAYYNDMGKDNKNQKTVIIDLSSDFLKQDTGIKEYLFCCNKLAKKYEKILYNIIFLFKSLDGGFIAHSIEEF